MIESIDRIVTVKASDLPNIFSILVEKSVHYFERTFSNEDTIYFRNLDTNEELWTYPDNEIAILIPDSLSDPVTYAEIAVAMSDPRGSI